MTDTALMRELDFTDADLTANRAGNLSEMQLYRLKLRRTRSIAFGAGLVLVLAFAASLCIYGGVRGNGILLVVGLGVTVCSAAVTGTFARWWLRLSADLRDKAVSAFSGRVERVVKPVNSRVVVYLLRVGGAEFTVNKETFIVFAQDSEFTLYRAKFTGTLVSAEAH